VAAKVAIAERVRKRMLIVVRRMDLSRQCNSDAIDRYEDARTMLQYRINCKDNGEELKVINMA